MLISPHSSHPRGKRVCETAGVDFVFFPLLALWIVGALGNLIGALVVLRHFGKSVAPGEKKSWPGISVLKPLKGVESDLEDNLVTFFELDYPDYEIIFCIADADDPARPVVEALMRRYPEVSAKLILGYVEAGPNPKVNNLLRPLVRAKHDLVLVCDSNVRATAGYLKLLASEMNEDVGVVTGIVAARGAKNLAGALEAVYLNGFLSRCVLCGSKVGIPFVMGKTMLFRRSVVARFGGLRGLSQYIAEDFWMGQKVKEAGLKIKMLRVPIHQHIGAYRFSSFWSRHLRWGRIRRFQALGPFLLEPLGMALGSSVMGALALSHFIGGGFWGFLLASLFFFAGVDCTLAARLGDGFHPRLIVAWFMREACSIPMWLHTLIGNRVLWRGNRLRLHRGGTVSLPKGSWGIDETTGPLIDSVIQVI